MSSSNTESPSIKRLKAARALTPADRELWKYFEDRADRLGDRLWTIGVWLMTVIAGTLTMPFAAKFVDTSGGAILGTVTARAPVAMIAIFGLLFCAYSYAALRDLRDHIESNWRKAGYILTGTWESSWGGRKSHGWMVMIGVGGLSALAFLLLLVAAAAA